MAGAPPTPNESERLSELRNFDILDTVAEASYDAITYLASQICDTPIALVSLIDEDRQWFKSRVGLDAAETPRDQAFCAYAIHDPDSILMVRDALEDPRFATNPLVVGDPSIRFYAGAPLVTPTGSALGTLCVIDREPRELSLDQQKSLLALSTQVMALLELRAAVKGLEEKQVELEELSRQRDTFMATVSHEIRTPLTAVIGYVEMLREDGSEEFRHDILETIARQAAEVEFLVEDLLVAARAEADSLRVAKVSVHLAAQVAQVLEGLNPADSRDVAVHVDGCRVIGDPARVRQIIRNLITNAFRYGGPNVQVVVGTFEGRCRLMVIDDGEGVPVEDREKIFEQFGQASNAKDVAASVGLGLPISRLLAEKMHGTLEYRSEDGTSIFELILPADLPN